MQPASLHGNHSSKAVLNPLNWCRRTPTRSQSSRGTACGNSHTFCRLLAELCDLRMVQTDAERSLQGMMYDDHVRNPHSGAHFGIVEMTNATIWPGRQHNMQLTDMRATNMSAQMQRPVLGSYTSSACGGAQSWPKPRQPHQQPITEVKAISRRPQCLSQAPALKTTGVRNVQPIVRCRSVHCCAALPPSGVRLIHLPPTPLARRICLLRAMHSRATTIAATPSTTDPDSSTCKAKAKRWIG